MENKKTKFAPPERAGKDELARQERHILEQEMFLKALDLFPKVVLVLNPNRQVVFCNRTLCNLLGVQPGEILGKRPGEIFNCIHSGKEPDGCGTSLFCRECGAVRSILFAQKGNENAEECRMTYFKDGKEQSLDLKVWSVPHETRDGRFVIFIIDDIANEKRRESLEKTFFHDVLNEAGIILGYLDNMVDKITPADSQSLEQLRQFAKGVVRAIESHRDLIAAESGKFKLFISEIEIRPFMKALVGGYAVSKTGKGKKIELDCPEGKMTLRSDQVLLERVMGNLIKNALEASQPGGTVAVAYGRKEERHCFSVHNDTVMPENIRIQIFQRSFSTKGRGRGIGTYSVKFFTENYLGGRVYFKSEEGRGTTFFIELA